MVSWKYDASAEGASFASEAFLQVLVAPLYDNNNNKKKKKKQD